MSHIHDPLWQRWLAHTLHGASLGPILQPARPTPRVASAPVHPSAEEIDAVKWESGLPHGFPFPWM
jgi:hypothetical protein